MNGQISEFLRSYLKHYNAGTVIDAANAWRDLISKNGKMMVTLAGAFSTGEMGKLLAECIRQGYVSCISCTGANLEEDIFNLVGRPYYKRIPNYPDLNKQDEKKIYDSNANRVTDTTIPDKVMVPVADAILKVWQRNERMFPHEALWTVLREGTLKPKYAINPAHSWMLAAMEKNIMMVVPGWEDSTLGNNFAAHCIMGDIKSPTLAKSGVEYMMALAKWYSTNVTPRNPIGFFQVGGGIAGDFPICVVPMLHEELDQEDIPKFSYFCQVTDAEVSYGGYSGAYPNEKITWGKLDVDTPSFNIKSDASIVTPLIFSLVLGW